MKLWMSGEVDESVYDVFRSTRREVEDRVNRLLATSDYGGHLQEWVVIPILTRIAPPDYPEIAKLGANRVAEFRLRIAYDGFVNGTAQARRALVLDLLIRSAQMMSEIGVADFDADRLAADLDGLKGEATQD